MVDGEDIMLGGDDENDICVGLIFVKMEAPDSFVMDRCKGVGSKFSAKVVGQLWEASRESKMSLAW